MIFNFFTSLIEPANHDIHKYEREYGILDCTVLAERTANNEPDELSERVIPDGGNSTCRAANTNTTIPAKRSHHKRKPIEPKSVDAKIIAGETRNWKIIGMEYSFRLSLIIEILLSEHLSYKNYIIEMNIS